MLQHLPSMQLWSIWLLHACRHVLTTVCEAGGRHASSMLSLWGLSLQEGWLQSDLRLPNGHDAIYNIVTLCQAREPHCWLT